MLEMNWQSAVYFQCRDGTDWDKLNWGGCVTVIMAILSPLDSVLPG